MPFIDFIIQHFKNFQKLWSKLSGWAVSSFPKLLIVITLLLAIPLYLIFYQVYPYRIDTINTVSNSYSNESKSISDKIHLREALRWINACIEMEGSPSSNKTFYCKKAKKYFKENARVGLKADGIVDAYIKNASYRAMRIEIETNLDSYKLSGHSRKRPNLYTELSIYSSGYFYTALFLILLIIPTILLVKFHKKNKNTISSD